jgi:hypothetical protein
MGVERNDSALRFVEALRRLGEETASLADSSVEQAQHELGDAAEVLRDTVTAAIEEAGPELAAAAALGRKLGYACIGLASLVEEELERRLSDLPIAEAFRQAYSPERRRGRGV